MILVFIFGFLCGSSIFLTSSEQRNIVQLCTNNNLKWGMKHKRSIKDLFWGYLFFHENSLTSVLFSVLLQKSPVLRTFKWSTFLVNFSILFFYFRASSSLWEVGVTPHFCRGKMAKTFRYGGVVGPKYLWGKFPLKTGFVIQKCFFLALFGQFYCGSFHNDGIYGSQRRKGHSTSFKDFFFVTFNWDQGHHSQLLWCWTL